MTARCQRAPATHCGVWLTKVLVRLKAMNFDAEGERFSSRLCERRGSEGGTLMDDFNTQLDELQNEINGLRSDLDDLRDEVETMSERIEEEMSRGNKARLAMWAQTEDGKRYLRLKLIWDTFLSLRKVTERDRKAFALKVAGRKPEWSTLRLNVRGICSSGFCAARSSNMSLSRLKLIGSGVMTGPSRHCHMPPISSRAVPAW